jgi:uncharacterized protein
MRVVFDTNTLISALLFRGEAAWLVRHWQDLRIVPLACHETAAELLRVLAYPKFGLTSSQVEAVAARFVAFVERVQLSGEASVSVRCRDSKDQVFVELAFQGKADVLVTGDSDLLSLAGTVPFAIESPAAYRKRAASTGSVV